MSILVSVLSQLVLQHGAETFLCTSESAGVEGVKCQGKLERQWPQHITYDIQTAFQLKLSACDESASIM